MKISQSSRVKRLLDEKTKKGLIKQALQARKMSYSPYSKFRVGAAVITVGGDIFTGTNIENASYGATMCAERVAVFKAISEGHRKDIIAVAIASDQRAPIPPCGMCRQVLSELPNDVEVLMVGSDGKSISERLSKLLPYKFEL